MWRHIAESVQGTSHVAAGTPCQDHSAARLFGDGAESSLVACIGDGAGYAEHSDVGSRIACESIVDSATTRFESKGSFADIEKSDILRWCEAARNKIADHAALHDRPLREYATTLCAAIASDRGSTFFQIGDGAIIARQHGVLGVVFWPQSGEYVNTTNFLTADGYLDHVQVCITPSRFSDLALFTDGIERLALRFDSRTPHPQFFQPLFEALRTTIDLAGLGEALRQFLQSKSLREKNDDDKTLVLATSLARPADDAHSTG